MPKRNIGKILSRMKANNATPLALKVMENRYSGSNVLYTKKIRIKRIKQQKETKEKIETMFKLAEKKK